MSESQGVEAAEAVTAALEAYLERERLAHDRFAAAVDREIDGPFAERARATASSHQTRLEALRVIVSGGGEGEPAVVPDAVRAYRRATVDEVLRPLCELLTRLDCGEAICRLASILAEELAGAANDAPDRLQRPEPPALYLWSPGEPWHRATGKALARGGRRTRRLLTDLANRLRAVTGREPRPLPDRVQDVPLRRLVAYHAAVRLAAVRARVLRDLQASLGARVAGLESATSHWIHSLLALESTLDAAGERAAGAEGPAVPQAKVPSEETEPAGEGFRAAAMDAFQFAEQLQATLVEAADAGAGPDIAPHLAAADSALRDDVERVGSFMLDEGRRAVPAQPVRTGRESERANADWMTWHRQAVARLRLDIATADFRDALIHRRTALARTLEHDAASPVDRWLAETAEALRDLRAAVEEGCTRARQAADASALGIQLRSIEEQALEILRRESPRHVPIGELQQFTRNAADGCVDGVLEAIKGFDEAVTVHERPLAGVTVHAAARAVRVRVREMAEQAFDAVLLERIRTSTRPADDVFAGVAALEPELAEVIRFNLGAALDEIGAGEPDSARLDGAQELALNGLDRSVAALLGMREQVRQGVRGAETAARQASRTGWDRFHDRVMVEDRVQDQLLDLRYRIRSALHEAARWTRQEAGKLLRTTAGHARTVRDRSLQLLRVGRAAVEGERISLEDKRATVDALSTLGTVLAGLPLVYRRLFSLQPVEDPALLVGREADLDAVGQHFEHWRMGITDALLITGSNGSGRTSLLNIVRDRMLAGTDVHSVVLAERCLEEAAFVRLLEPALPIETGRIATFAAVAAALREAAPPERPRVIVVEQLEHALLRTASGNGLLGRIFSLMSATDSHIFWLGSMSRSAWDYIQRTEPLSPGLVRHYPLSALGRDQFEEIVMRRHLRSGLPIRFESPAAPGPALGRRLRRAGSEPLRQSLLKAEFFDRLYRASEQDITLALFYWLRSASVERTTGTLNVRPFEPLNFGHLDELTLPQCFSLKAFLDHGSLTLEEYGLIFAARPGEAQALFESLGNLLLIEPVAPETVLADFRFGTISDAARYRIRPLAAHSVVRNLRARNLLLQ